MKTTKNSHPVFEQVTGKMPGDELPDQGAAGFHLFASATRESITGTSTSTPTTVTIAAGDYRPKSEIATATASSKKLLAPIIEAGAQMA